MSNLWQHISFLIQWFNVILIRDKFLYPDKGQTSSYRLCF